MSYGEIKEKGYCLSAGQFFEIKFNHIDITEEEFKSRMSAFEKDLKSMFASADSANEKIIKTISSLKFSK